MALKYHALEFIVDSLEDLVFGDWMHEKYSLSVQVKASKRLGSDNRESNNCHNHACDKTKLM
jgi:hypothetical protein